MKNIVDRYQDQLRDAGLRATPTRMAVLQALTKYKKPVAVSVILRNLGRSADQATIYRILGLFAKNGLAKGVVVHGGATWYELADLPHHHHLVCEVCGRMEDVQGCLVQGVPKNSSFAKVTEHRLEFSGVCKKCS